MKKTISVILVSALAVSLFAVSGSADITDNLLPDTSGKMAALMSSGDATGDLDNDGEVTSNDALKILRVSVGLETFTQEQTVLADLDNDGEITSNDALSVLRKSVGLDDSSEEYETEALYLGVHNYGDETVNKDTKESFRYRFLIGGVEKLLKIDSGEININGDYDYPIQNTLKENYRFRITIKNDTVIAADELPSNEKLDFEPVVSGTPGKKTLANFLKTSMEPVGTTLYIYGGGWNWQDNAASSQAVSIGVSSDWVKFFNEQDVNFTYRSKDGNEDYADPAHSYYPYGEYNEYYYAGLDCSGYVGWAIYNTLETESGKEGYVTFACAVSDMLSELGYGERTVNIAAPSADNEYEMKPGDIMSLDGHVWISLGTCSDGSVVIAHSSPGDSRTGQPGGGVQISAVGLSTECEAYKLADKYMSQYYPEWYERYPVMLNDPDVYFEFEDEDAGRFTWDTKGGKFSDPENIAEMTPTEVLEFLFGESSELTANDALSIVLQNTDYTEDELTSNDLITESGETFHALSFYRNGTYVFYVRDKDGKFFTSDDFNKAYNEDYDGYIGHD